MDSKEKRSSSISMKERLSKLLGIEKDSALSGSSKTPKQILEMKEESEKKYFIDILKNLSKTQPPEIRLTHSQPFCNFVRTYRLHVNI
jgi:hypothetical protein